MHPESPTPIPSEITALAGSAILHWNAGNQQTVADIFDEVAKQHEPFNFICALLDFTREIVNVHDEECTFHDPNAIHDALKGYLLKIAAGDC